MDWDSFLVYAPTLFIIMSAYILYELYRIHKIDSRWEIESLAFIPALIMILYFWIGFMHPTIENARTGLRLVLTTCLSNATHVIYQYRKSLYKKGGK